MTEELQLTPDEQLRADVLSICSALGAMEEYQTESGDILTKYAMGDECLSCMKDLRGFIRNDSENTEYQVLHLLGEFNIMSSDLIPIVLVNAEQNSEVAERLILACLELFVPMTWPLRDDVEDDEEADGNMRNLHMRYKIALMTSGVLEAALSVIIKPLSVPYRERAQRDHVVIRLVLTLLRNLAAIPDLNASQFSTENALEMSTMQQKYLTRLEESKMLELIVTIASSSSHPDFEEWNIIALQIIFYLLKRTDPYTIAFSGIEQDNKPASIVSEKLAEMMQQENKNRLSVRQVAPTRHNRFGGSYSVQVMGGEKYNIHHQTGGTVDLTSIMNKNKKEYRVGKKKTLQDKFETSTPYRDQTTRRILCEFATSVLDTSFNALVSSLLKDIERENKKILEPDHHKFYYVVGWLLQFRSQLHSKWTAEVQQQKDQQADTLTLPNRHTSDESNGQNGVPESPASYDLVGSAMDIRFFLLCIRRMRQTIDEKGWLDVQVCAECFKQMLLTINEMAESGNSEFVDIADYIQSNIYYEQSTLDLFVDMIRGYRYQSKGYLRSVVELTHCMLKMLERFASRKKYMFVRKAKKSHKPKENKANESTERVEASENGDSEDEEETYEEERDRKQAYREHQFKFESFESRFANDEVVRIYCILLEDFQTLPGSSLNAITSLFHRLMVKRQLEHLFFKASIRQIELPILELFNRILPTIKYQKDNTAYQQLSKFIRYCIKQYVKEAQSNPLFLVESLFKGVRKSALKTDPKDKNESDDEPVTRLRDHEDSDDDGYQQITNFPTTVELEIKPGLTWSQQLGVVIAVLLDDKKEFLLDWLTEQMIFVIGKRAMEDTQPVDDNDGEPQASRSVRAYEYYDMEPTMIPVKSALRKNSKFRLLLKLLEFEKTEDDYMETTWTIPGSTTSESLQTNIQLIKQFIANPLAPNGKPASEMIKKKARKKRARKDLDDDESAARKRTRRTDTAPVYHTQQFVIDSDEDDDDAFFTNEAKLREKNMAAFLSNFNGSSQEQTPLTLVASEATAHSLVATEKNVHTSVTRIIPSDESSSNDDDNDEDMPLFTSGRDAFLSTSDSRTSSQDVASSAMSHESDKVVSQTTLQRLTARQNSTLFDEDDDTEVTSLQIQRRRHRAILDDSEDDDI